MTNFVREDSQEQLDNQAPSVQVLLPGKFGEIDPKSINFQANQQSAPVLLTRWLENLLIPASPLGYLYNCGISFVFGAAIFPLISSSFWATVWLMPVIFVYFGLGYLTKDSHIERTFWFYSGLIVLGFVLSVILHYGI